MQEHLRPLHMPQEFMTESFAFRSAFYETWDVSEDVSMDCSEIRIKGREGITGHLCVGICKRIQKAGFAGIRQADQSGIGDEIQFYFEIGLCAFDASCRLLRPHI